MRLEVRKKQRGVYGHSLDEMNPVLWQCCGMDLDHASKGEGTGLGDVWGCWFHFTFSVVFRGQQKQKGSYIIKKEEAFTTTNDF